MKAAGALFEAVILTIFVGIGISSFHSEEPLLGILWLFIGFIIVTTTRLKSKPK